MGTDFYRELRLPRFTYVSSLTLRVPKGRGSLSSQPRAWPRHGLRAEGLGQGAAASQRKCPDLAVVSQTPRTAPKPVMEKALFF